MPTSIPLIRAGSLVAFVEWLEAKGRPVDEYLAAVGVPGDPVSDPERSIPLRSAMAFIRDAALREGLPDLAWRVVRESSVAGLGSLGRAALAGATVADGLARIAQTMPAYCTHESFAFIGTAEGGTLEVAFSIMADPDALHHAQLYTLALVAAFCAAVHPQMPFFEQVSLPPLPGHGLGHVPRDVARSLSAASDGVMRVTFVPSVLRAQLPRPEPTVSVGPGAASATLREQSGFLGAARLLVSGMVADGEPSVERLAKAAGVNPRTLQRRFAKHGTSFSALVDEARREKALAQIAGNSAPVGEIAAMLGYSSPSSLTRAVRRWTDLAPRDLRRRSRTAARGPDRDHLHD